MRSDRVFLVQLAERFLRDDDAAERLFAFQSHRVVLTGLPQPAPDPDAWHTMPENGLEHRVEDVAAVKHKGCRPVHQVIKPDGIHHVIGEGFGMQGGFRNQRHDIEAIGFDQPQAGREGRKNRRCRRVLREFARNK